MRFTRMLWGDGVLVSTAYPSRLKERPFGSNVMRLWTAACAPLSMRTTQHANHSARAPLSTATHSTRAPNATPHHHYRRHAHGASHGLTRLDFGLACAPLAVARPDMT